jgi:hypothetical protein
MINYRYDNNNYYLGTVTLQESPLEQGVFFTQSNCTSISPPVVQQNEIAYWNDSNWEIRPNYSDKTYYSKIDKSQKKYEIGETPVLEIYTVVQPLENESFQKWNEETNTWIIDEDSKNEFELRIRQTNIQRLLLESDYIELPSFLERKGQEIYNTWMTYRANLRAAYHDSELPLPQAPE